MIARFGAILAEFQPPSTKDFVWGCWGPSLRIGGLNFCLNFIFFLVLLGFVLFLAFFFFGLRRPTVVPGKLQSLVEMGIQFVRENIALPMLGPDIVVVRFPPVPGLHLALHIGNVPMAKQGMEEIEHIRPGLFERLLTAIGYVHAGAHNNVLWRDGVAMLG